MRFWNIAAVAAVAGLATLSGVSAARADGWTDTLSSRPWVAAKPSKPTYAPVDRPQRKTASLPSVPTGSSTTGIASYYWQPQPVASGGRFNPNAMTAAHKTLPFGTKVRVTHLGNGQSVDVVINDRGPYIQGRIIDLSKAAAGKINMQGQGIAQVRVDVMGR